MADTPFIYRAKVPDFKDLNEARAAGDVEKMYRLAAEVRVALSALEEDVLPYVRECVTVQSYVDMALTGVIEGPIPSILQGKTPEQVITTLTPQLVLARLRMAEGIMHYDTAYGDKADS